MLRPTKILLLAAALVSFASAPPRGSLLPDRLYLDDRPDVAWVSLEAARASGPTSDWVSWGASSPTILLGAMEQIRRWPEQRESARDQPLFEALERWMRWRDADGKCLHALVVGGSGPHSFSAPEFLALHRTVVAGTIRSRTLGFLYGRPVTVYGLEVDVVLRGAKDRFRGRARTLFIPHGDFDATIEGQDVCYWARSRPKVPVIGRRAIVGIYRRPLVLWKDTAKRGRRYVFAGSWADSNFWFESENGSAWADMPGGSWQWSEIEQAIKEAAGRLAPDTAAPNN